MPFKKNPETESYVEELLKAGPFQSRYISPDEVQFKLAGLERWKWLWDALRECPEDQSVLIDVPEGQDCARMANCIRSAVVMSRKTSEWKWSVRQTKDEKSIIITRGEARGRLTATLERQREGELQPPAPRKLTRIAKSKPDWDRTSDGKLDEQPPIDEAPKIGQVEAILTVLEDRGPLSRDELVDYVEELRPASLRASIHNQLSIMLKDGRLEKREDQRLQLNAALPIAQTR